MIIELQDITVGDIVLRRVYNAGAGSASSDTRFNQSGSYFYTPSGSVFAQQAVHKAVIQVMSISIVLVVLCHNPLL